MRCFFVTSEYLAFDTLQPMDGGLAQYLCKITIALQARGHDVGVVVWGAPQRKVVEWQGVRVHFIPYGRLHKSFGQRIRWPFMSRTAKARLRDRARMATIADELHSEHAQRPIDIVQYASYRGLGRYPVADIPSCVRISSYAKLWLGAYGQDVSDELLAEVEQFRRTRFLYGPSRLVADAICRDMPLSRPIDIIETPFVPYAGTEDDACVRELRQGLSAHAYLLFFGTIGLLKGAGEIAASIDRILCAYPQLDLVLVGKETPSDGFSPVADIRRAAGEQASRVHVFDRQPKATLMPLVRGAKAVLLPSRVDNLPNACIEAMGCGKIVIGSRGASFDQLIDDGVNGLLCTAGDADSIVSAVDRLMALSPDQIADMEKAAAHIVDRLSLEAIVPQVEAYYRKVIAAWRSP